jgi:hypothetical protein
MRTKSKTPGLRIVGGTAYGSPVTETSSSSEPVSRRSEPPRRVDVPPSTETARNGKLREQRYQTWREAEAATRYWRARLDLDRAVVDAQRLEIPEGRNHPAIGSEHQHSKDQQLVKGWREALVRQLLTPASHTAHVAWKQNVLARGRYKYSGLNAERLERAIADDLAFLAAHPVRHENSEAALRRREFNEAMRRRIRDVAASRDLSDEEIKAALTLKHQALGRFCEQYGVNIKWLLGGDGPPDRGGRCELIDILDGA